MEFQLEGNSWPQACAAAWFSRTRMMGTFWASLAVPMATIMFCFGLWLSEGCSPFWPFISDLGIYGSMIPVFSGGVSCTAILIAIVFVDMVVARHHAESSWTFCLAQAFTLLMGCVLALGMWEVAQLPWNIFLWQHLKWAFRLFGAGFFALIGNAVSLWMLPTVSLEDHRHKLWTLRIQVSLLVLATLLLFLMKHYTHYAFQSWADAFEYFHTAKVDFHGYCSEKSFDAKSGQAVMEWLFTMCLLGSIVTFYQEFNNVRQDIWCSADCKPLLPRQRLLKGQSEGP